MQQNLYVKTNWRDHIVDIETGQVIQEGTRFTASRANNIEDGIYGAYESLGTYQDELTRLRIQLEMLGRAPTNNGTFFDALDGDTAKQLTRLTSAAVSQHALSAGATSITLDFVPFKAGEYVTIYDDEQQETVKITAVTDKEITTGALTNMYKKGARVSRSNARLDTDRQRMIFDNWGSYDIEIMEVV